MENEVAMVDSPAEKPKPYSVARAVAGILLLPAVLFGVMVTSAFLIRDSGIAFDQSASFALSSSSFLVAAVLYTLLIGKIKSIGSFLKLNSFRWSHILVGLAGALVTYIGAILVGMIAVYINSIGGATELGSNSTTETIGALSQKHSIFLIGFLIAVLAPIGEELFFRGAMLGSLVQESSKRWLRVGSVILVSAIFGFFHLQGTTGTAADWLAMITPGLVGVTGAILTLKFNSLYPAIFNHLFYNGIVLLVIVSSAG